MWNLIEDLKYGKMREKIVVCFLNKDIFKDDRLKLYSNERKQVDFRNKEIVGELKSRTNKHNTYETTFFGYNKIKYLIEEKDQRVWKFYFLFTDGLYVWTYNKSQYEVRDYDHREKGVIPQVYVPIKYLEKISSIITSNSWLPQDWEDHIN
tara:strand:- start:1531 stop:1983 length:453 start_codon:yes stop_codon:yes gene_type:complete